MANTLRVVAQIYRTGLAAVGGGRGLSEQSAQLGPARRSPRFPSSKFAVPRVPARLVQRTRLFEALDHGHDARLTLVVGSAGAGKSVLLADWIASRPERVCAWISADAADADPVRLLAAIVEALRRSGGRPDLGEDALDFLSVDGGVSADVVAALVEDLESGDETELVVIDDVHLAGPSGGELLGSLVAYWPPSVRLVVSSRVDPPLRLHRMRAHGELMELRDRDLSFSLDETEQFLDRYQVRLGEDALAAVHRDSEGWAAGLQMTAISAQHSPGPVTAAERAEIRGRTMAGYFVDEVLHRQPAEVVDFMLATSILDELSPTACVALCGEEGATLLDRVFRANLFVVMLDEEARTYRYHHLIRDVLRSEMHGGDPERGAASTPESRPLHGRC